MSAFWPAFAKWLREEQHFAKTTVRQRLRDAKVYLRDPGVYDSAPSRDRKRQYRLAVEDLHAFVASETRLHLDIPKLPPVPAEPEPETRHERRARRKARPPRLPMEAGHLRAIHNIAADLAPTSATNAVILVMTETALRVGDVLRVPRIALRDGLAREDGVFPLVLKGEKHALASVRASSGWGFLYQHMTPRAGAEHPGHVRIRRRLRENVADTVTPGYPDASAGMAAYKAVYRALEGVCLEAKVPVISPHKLRHAVATWFRRESGAGRGEVRDLLGHESEAEAEAYLDGAGGNPVRIADLLQGFNHSFYKR